MLPTIVERATAPAAVAAPPDALTRTCQDFTSARLVAALESAWSTIRARHPQVPAVVMVLGSGTPSRPGEGVKLGHFAALRWQHGERRLPEVLVSGEGLAGTANDVLTTLLHEAAHALADVRGVQDTSRQGRWHNTRFAAHARELGLVVTKDKRLGWSPSTLPPSTRDEYVMVLDELGAAMGAWRHPDDSAGTRKRASSNNGHALTCECPRRIRVAASTVEVGPIICGACDAPFLTDDQRAAGADVLGAYRHLWDPTGVHHGGRPTYPYRLAPSGLATRRQLARAGLCPGRQPVAAQILWRRGKRVAHLYRIDLAAPKRPATPAQLAALDRAMRARRTCPTCGQVKDYCIPRRYGECLDCVPDGAR